MQYNAISLIIAIILAGIKLSRNIRNISNKIQNLNYAISYNKIQIISINNSIR